MEEKVIENELISVIVPIYNVEKYLEKCVNSIFETDICEFRNNSG